MEDVVKERVNKELKELYEKFEKLEAFIYSHNNSYEALSNIQKELLSLQHIAMALYIQILEYRLSNWI